MDHCHENRMRTVLMLMHINKGGVLVKHDGSDGQGYVRQLSRLLCLFLVSSSMATLPHTALAVL